MVYPIDGTEDSAPDDVMFTGCSASSLVLLLMSKSTMMKETMRGVKTETLRETRPDETRVQCCINKGATYLVTTLDLIVFGDGTHTRWCLLGRLSL